MAPGELLVWVLGGTLSAGWAFARLTGTSGSKNIFPDAGAFAVPGYVPDAPSPAIPSLWTRDFEEWGRRIDVDPRLLRAIAQQESGENASAIGDRHLASGPSVGLMQILATGWPGPITRTMRGIEGWPPAYPNQLLEPRYNVSIAAQLLDDAIGRYGRSNVEKVLADYNGGPRRAAEWPHHRNRDYTDSVLARYRALLPNGGIEV